MPFVLDCSVTLAWVFADAGDETTEALRDSLAHDTAFVPALWPVDVANVLLLATRRGRIAAPEWPRVSSHLLTLPIEVDATSADRDLTTVLALAQANDLSVHDATYLELALRLDLPIATLDRQLADAARANELRVL